MTESKSAAGGGRPVRVRAGAKAKITAGEAVLLVKERHADGSVFWTLPGGGVHPGESPADCLRRELREELGCRVFVGDRTDTMLYVHRSTAATLSTYSVYDCALASEPAPRPEEGTLEYRWVRPGEFPARTLPQIRLSCR